MHAPDLTTDMVIGYELATQRVTYNRVRVLYRQISDGDLFVQIEPPGIGMYKNFVYFALQYFSVHTEQARLVSILLHGFRSSNRVFFC